MTDQNNFGQLGQQVVPARSLLLQRAPLLEASPESTNQEDTIETILFITLMLILTSRSCFSPADVSNFIRLAANTCGANQASGVWAAGFKSGDVVAGIPFTAFGLVDATNPGVLYVP